VRCYEKSGIDPLEISITTFQYERSQIPADFYFLEWLLSLIVADKVKKKERKKERSWRELYPSWPHKLMVEEGAVGKCFSNDDTCQLDYTTSYPTSNVTVMVTAARIPNLYTLAQ
jgi:hypothetical protein